ncbi:hypothetical protein DFH09DRAFT_1318154 [Mycena vulgaris]|nr:hypothetical protein DFH09DRAFT_1318154 [Mycena vulgaris]
MIFITLPDESTFLTITEFIRTGDDSVFEAALENYWSPDLQEENIATSVSLTHASFRNLLLTLRSEIVGRAPISETFVVSTPADLTEKTGAVGYTHVFTGVQAGKKITATIAAVMCINWVEDPAHVHGGHREIVTEAFVLNIS